MVKTDGGFVDTSSVEPGLKRVVYAYTLPYKSGKNILERTIDYPTERFILLVSDSGVRVNVDGLKSSGTVQVSEGRFLQWTGSGISPGTRIRIEIGKPILGQDLLKWAVFGAVVILIGGSILYSFVIKKKTKTVKDIPTSSVSNNSTSISNLEEEKAKLIQEIVELDDRFESKEIGEEEYKEVRSRKKESLIEITRRIKKG